MFKVTVLPGDGIGAEVTASAIDIIKSIQNKIDLKLELSEGIIGGACYDKIGMPCNDEVLEFCKDSDAVFLGAIGGPKWDNLPFEVRPERALLKLRKVMDVYSNLRPIKIYDSLKSASPLKEEILNNVDMLIVRELTGGLYFGIPKEIKPHGDGERAVDTMVYETWEVERVAIAAFEIAMKRDKRVTSVDKANILLTSNLWRDTVIKVAKNYPEVELDHLLVDNCAMQLLRDPGQFDVILTENTFGDILSDEASMLTGSLGMLPSASIGENSGLYEPVHGSAPDIMGKNVANPIGAINSTAMMFRYSLKNDEAANIIEAAVEKTLIDGYRTADIAKPDDKLVSTTDFTEQVKMNLESM